MPRRVCCCGPWGWREMFTLTEGTGNQRATVRAWLAGLDAVSPETAERIITAWVTTWTSSLYAALEDIPFSANAPGYPLMRHINEVTEAGRALMPRLWRRLRCCLCLARLAIAPICRFPFC